MADRPFNILFLCTGNSARSILAEAATNHLAISRGRFKAYSAGSQPKGEVHPISLDILRNARIDTSMLRSKNWDEFARPDAPLMDFIFTVCDQAAGEQCPYWPGQPMTAHWGMPDPAAAVGTEAQIRKAFTDTFIVMCRRIDLLANLPIKSLDRLSLQHRVTDIGKQTIDVGD